MPILDCDEFVELSKHDTFKSRKMTKIYLISPEQIELKSFSNRLKNVLKTGLVPAFQMRLKNYSKIELKNNAIELKKICDDHNCLFLINDFLDLALEISASGAHLGIEDVSIASARKLAPKNFVIGASCYDSRDLAIQAAEQGANYLSFGAFFPSKTKISRGKPTTEIIKWCNDFINLPIVTIGGIDDQNCQSLAKAGADFVSVISYVWNNGVISEVEAVKKLNESLK